MFGLLFVALLLLLLALHTYICAAAFVWPAFLPLPLSPLPSPHCPSLCLLLHLAHFVAFVSFRLTVKHKQQSRGRHDNNKQQEQQCVAQLPVCAVCVCGCLPGLGTAYSKQTVDDDAKDGAGVGAGTGAGAGRELLCQLCRGRRRRSQGSSNGSSRGLRPPMAPIYELSEFSLVHAGHFKCSALRRAL